MAQTSDFDLDAGIGGLAQRVQLNAMVAALLSNHSGPTAPSPTVAGMLWLDTGVSPVVLRQRNAANAGWFVNTPEAVPAFSLWGNNGGGAAPANTITAADALTMLGFSFDNGAVKKQQIASGMRLEGGTGVTGASGVLITYSTSFAATPMFLAFPFNEVSPKILTCQSANAASLVVQGWNTSGSLTSTVFQWLAFGK